MQGFDHVNRSVRLRAWLNNPAVLGTRKDFVVDLTRPAARYVATKCSCTAGSTL